MVRVIFDGSNIQLPAARDQQVVQTGGGGGPIAYFEGLPLQRGYGYRQHGRGVGAVLRGLWRYLRPLASSAKPVVASIAKELGKEGLATGARVLNEVVQGKNIGEATVAESKEGARRLLAKAQSNLGQKGTGRGRKRKHPTVTLKPSDVIGQTVPQKALLKKKRLDALGYY